MNSLTKDGWEAIESGGMNRAKQQGQPRRSGKDKEIKCFTTFPSESFEVLNELVVDRGPSPYVSLLELFGDNDHLTSAQADGITVSTPTGSTAYSVSILRSIFGFSFSPFPYTAIGWRLSSTSRNTCTSYNSNLPVSLSSICAFTSVTELVETSPRHTLSFRPMLLPDSMELRICVPYNSRSTAWASFDGRGQMITYFYQSDFICANNLFRSRSSRTKTYESHVSLGNAVS